MQNLGDALSGGTMCVGKAGLAEGTNAATIKTAAPNGAGTDYMIDGILYEKADTDNIAMNALAIQAADTTCIYLVQIDSAGTVTMKKGTEQLNTDLAAGNKFLNWPRADSGKCPIGAVKVKTVAVTFTNGTTDLSAAGITGTYYDLATIPSVPLSS